MLIEEKLTERIIDPEVRTQLQERLATDVYKLLRRIFATVIGSILVALGLKYFHLM